MTRESKPLLVYDGECSFCRAWIERWRRVIGDEVELATYQEVADRFPEIPPERFARAVHFRDANARWSRGAEAVFRSLAVVPRHRPWLWLYERVPPFRWVSERIYRLVAGHRPAFTRLTRAIWGAHLVPRGNALTSWIFLRSLGVILLVAFVSLWVQILGLVGHDGILPAREYLDSLARAGPIRFWAIPTVLWLGAGDGALQLVCAAGTLCSVLVILDAAPAAALTLAWLAYLSLATVCRDFLWFQWDSLLLEVTFVAIFLAPWHIRPRSMEGAPAPRLARLALGWLLFRLLVASAAVKLTSGDPTWRDLTALRYHYETQPLPPWTAWYMHHLPASIHAASAIAMFTIEGLVPLLFLAPRRIRFVGATLVIALQIVLQLTGNFAFFNLLAIALALLLLDDGVWPARWRAWFARGVPREVAWRPPGTARAVLIAIIVLGLVPLLGAFRLPESRLGPLPAIYRAVSPLRLVNRYGLFAVMTTKRHEILLEGSADGRVWRAYEFRWKPGDPARRPEFVAPHQPRLDWQMWFAALGDVSSESWFLHFCERLLQGSPSVRALLGLDPFGGKPPKFLRATLHDYHFSDPQTRRQAGAWWVTRPLGLYVPVVLTLERGRLAAAPDSAGLR